MSTILWVAVAATVFNMGIVYGAYCEQNNNSGVVAIAAAITMIGSGVIMGLVFA